MKLISTEDLSIGYQKVLKSGINFSIDKGSYTVIIGENGSGKTTLIKTILGIIPSKSGHIKYNIDKKDVGYLPQKTKRKDYFPATVNEVILSGYIDRSDSNNIDELLREIGITKLKDRSINDLSGGETQKVHLARALASSSKLLIVDEGTSALSDSSRENFYEILSKINKKRGVTIMLISHDFEKSMQYASHVLEIGEDVKYFSLEKYLKYKNEDCEDHG